MTSLTQIISYRAPVGFFPEDLDHTMRCARVKRSLINTSVTIIKYIAIGIFSYKYFFRSTSLKTKILVVVSGISLYKLVFKKIQNTHCYQATSLKIKFLLHRIHFSFFSTPLEMSLKTKMNSVYLSHQQNILDKKADLAKQISEIGPAQMKIINRYNDYKNSVIKEILALEENLTKLNAQVDYTQSLIDYTHEYGVPPEDIWLKFCESSGLQNMNEFQKRYYIRACIKIWDEEVNDKKREIEAMTRELEIKNEVLNTIEVKHIKLSNVSVDQFNLALQQNSLLNETKKTLATLVLECELFCIWKKELFQMAKHEAKKLSDFLELSNYSDLTIEDINQAWKKSSFKLHGDKNLQETNLPEINGCAGNLKDLINGNMAIVSEFETDKVSYLLEGVLFDHFKNKTFEDQTFSSRLQNIKLTAIFFISYLSVCCQAILAILAKNKHKRELRLL